jgi:hypothetical protein
MAGYNLDKSGRSPADIKRLERNRKGQTKKTDTSSRSGFSDLKKKKKVRFGVGSNKTIERNGKKFANVTADQLKKTGLSQAAYMRMWNKTGKRPTAGVNRQPVVAGKVDRKGTSKTLSSKEFRSQFPRSAKLNRGLVGGTVKSVPSPVKRRGEAIDKDTAQKRGLTGDRTKLKKIPSTRETYAAQSRMAGTSAAGMKPKKVDKKPTGGGSDKMMEKKRSLVDKIRSKMSGLKLRDAAGEKLEEKRRGRNRTSAALRGGGMVKKTGMRGGGMVKKTGMKKGGMVKKTGMRKKSIDGIAR